MFNEKSSQKIKRFLKIEFQKICEKKFNKKNAVFKSYFSIFLGVNLANKV